MIVDVYSWQFNSIQFQRRISALASINSNEIHHNLDVQMFSLIKIGASVLLFSYCPIFNANLWKNDSLECCISFWFQSSWLPEEKNVIDIFVFVHKKKLLVFMWQITDQWQIQLEPKLVPEMLTLFFLLLNKYHLFKLNDCSA